MKHQENRQKMSTRCMASLGMLLILLVAPWGGASAQLRDRHFNRMEMLSNFDVLDIQKDAYGFIWFACNSSLIRFDGYELVLYNNHENNPYHIRIDEIWQLELDKDKQLWVSGGFKGCARYDYATEKFQYYDSIGTGPKMPLQFVRSMCPDADGNFWLGAENGLCCKTPSDNQFRLMADKTEDGLPLETAYAICHDGAGTIWIGNRRGNLFRYSIAEKKLTRYTQGSFAILKKEQAFIQDIFQDSRKNIWICGVNQALVIDPVTGKEHSMASLLPDPMKVFCVVEDPLKQLWFSAGGVGIYHPDNGSMETYVNNNMLDYTLSSNVTTRIHFDNQGIYWIGSWYGGVDVFNSNKKLFRLYHSRYCKVNSISNDIVHCFFEDEDHSIWIGTEDGVLNRFYPETEHFEYFTDPEMTINEAITGIAYGANTNELVLATWGAMKLYNKKTRHFQRLTHDAHNPASLGGNQISSLVRESDSLIWMSLDWGALEAYNPRTKAFIHHKELVQPEFHSGLSFIRTMYLDSKNNLWVVGWSTLFRYKSTERRIHRIEQSDTKPGFLSAGQVYCCYEDSKHRTWVGNSRGINLYQSDSSFVNFGKNYGLEDTEVNSILEDREGNLWLTTDIGISKFRLPSQVLHIDAEGSYRDSLPKDFLYFSNYDKFDGLQQENYLKGALTASNGTMYFGSTGGFNAFKPEEIVADSIHSPIRITELRIFNQLARPRSASNPNSPLTQSMVLTDAITLSNEQYIFTLKWASLNYYATPKINYAYILEGFEKHWNYVDARRTATYTGIPAGTYTFRVKATNADGLWNQPEAKLLITILPPWWKTWWFRTVVVLLILLSVVAISYIRVMNLRKQKRILENNVKERTIELQKANETKDKFFSIIAHDLKDPFSAIVGYSDLLQNNYSEYTEQERFVMIKQIYQVAERTFNLLTNLLSWSRAHSGKIDYYPETLSMQEYLNTNTALIKDSALKKGIKVEIGTRHDYEIYADPDSANTILRNLLTNAVKFTPRGGRIQLTARPVQEGRKKFIEITVRDTGVGMPQEKTRELFRLGQNISTKGTEKESGTGLGLLLCKEFVLSNGGTIRVESAEGKGSSFIFTLPMA